MQPQYQNPIPHFRPLLLLGYVADTEANERDEGGRAREDVGAQVRHDQDEVLEDE